MVINYIRYVTSVGGCFFKTDGQFLANIVIFCLLSAVFRRASCIGRYSATGYLLYNQVVRVKGWF